MRRLHGDLLRLGGLVKSLFIRPESLALAERHPGECARALGALTSAAEATIPVVSRVEDQLAALLVQIEQTMLALTHDH